MHDDSSGTETSDIDDAQAAGIAYYCDC